MMPRLSVNALLLADNMNTFPVKLQPYLDFVTQPDGPFKSIILAFDSGFQYAIYRGA